MKKTLAILMTVCLLASLFVACDNNAKIDELVSVSFDASDTRSLVVSNEAFIGFEDSNLIWQYKASKVTDDTYNVGATATWKAIPGETEEEAGRITNVVEFSQGKWNFELRAVKKGVSPEVVVYYGKTDTANPVLLTKQERGTKFNIPINLTAQLNGQKGYIVLSNISVKHLSNGVQTLDAPSKVFIDGALLTSDKYTSTTTAISTTSDGLEYEVGTHLVKVQKIGANNEVLAEEEKTIEVYAGLKTTVSNWIVEITQGGQFAPVAPTGSTSGNVSSATDGNLKLTVENVTPSMVSGNDTTVTVPTAVLGQETTATVSVAVKQASEASVDNSFTASNGNAVAAVIDLTLSVGTTPKTEFSSPIKVETYVAKNLSGFKFSYPGEEDEWSKKNSLEDVTAAKDYYYDGTTGKLTFFTDHFSSFVVETSSVAVIGDTAYSTFSDALSHASEGDTIVLINDIMIDYESGNCCISIEDKNITIDGSRNTISLRAESPKYDQYGLLVKGNDSSKIVTIKNATINTNNLERAIRTEGSIGVVIEDCTIKTNGCGIHVKGANEVVINRTQITVEVIDNNTYLAHLRTAVMVGGANANVLVNNSNIIATNESKADMAVTNWYWSWCKGLYVGNTGKKSTLTVSNTTVDADYSICIDGTEDSSNPSSITIENGTYKGLIASPSGNSYKSLTINGGTFSGITDLNSFNGKDNDIAKLVISGGTFNVEPDSKYIVDGYYAEKNGDGNYEVKKATNWIQLADTSWYDSSKTEFNVSSAEQLAGLAKLVNTGNNFSGKTIKLASDIVLSGLNWTPIGGAGSGKRFSGTFDGLTHTISGMEAVNNVNYGNGFFGDTIGATIKNITFTNAFVSANSNPLVYYGNVYGIVAGYSYGETLFENVHVSDSVISGYGKVGAILGMAADPGNHNTKFNNCTVDNVDMYGVYDVGGLAGLVQNKLIISGNNTSVTNLNWIKSSSEIYVKLNEALVVASEQYPSGSTCYLSGKPITGDYWKYGNYLYGGFAKYAVMYGTSAHDCTLTGDYSGYYLANMERVIDDLNQLSSLNNPWK